MFWLALLIIIIKWIGNNIINHILSINMHPPTIQNQSLNSDFDNEGCGGVGAVDNGGPETTTIKVQS